MSDDINYISYLYDNFYLPIFEKLDLKSNSKNLDTSSLFIKLMKSSENRKVEISDLFSVNENYLSPDMIRIFLDNKWIRSGPNPNSYFITAHGIWDIETGTGVIDIERLIDYIDEDKFKIKFGGKLSDEEKVVVFALIAIRSFYEKTPINRGGYLDQDVMLNLLQDVTIFLKDMGAIKKNFELGTGNAGETPVNSILRRKDHVPSKTKNIFHVPPKGATPELRNNYLSLYDENTNKIDIKSLAYLFWKIFSNDKDGYNLTYEQEIAIDQKCSELVLRYRNYIYTEEMLKYFVFTSIEHESAISDALHSIRNLKSCWDE